MPKGKVELDPTDEQIAGLILAGLTNKEIAAELSLKLGTVKSRLNRLYRAAGVMSRTQFALKLRDEQDGMSDSL